jgi:type IV pilus assembly protein PilM
MANRVLSIEIGSVITRVVEMDYKAKHPRIYRVFTFTTPPDIIADGMVNSSDIFISQLKANLSERRISTRHAIFVISSNRVANRIIQIPYVKANRVADLIKMNASEYFPVDLSEYALSHEILGQEMEGNEKKLQVALLAIPNDIIESYRNLAEAGGLTLVGLDYLGNSIKKMMQREIQEELKVTIRISEDSSVVTFMENEQVKLQRTVNYGIADTIGSVQQSNLFGENIDANEALSVLKRKTCILRRFDQQNAGLDEDADRDFEVDPVKMKALRIELTENLRPLVASLSRVLDYYQTRNSGKLIRRIYLVGIGSACSGLAKLLSNELDFRVVAVQQYADIALSKQAQKENVHVAEYFVCLGAALEPVSFSVNDKRGKTRKVNDASDSFALPILICGLGLIAAAALAIYPSFVYKFLREENLMLKTQESNLSYIEEIVAEYDAAKADNDWALAVEDTTTSYNDNLVAFIGELEQKMPSEINVLTISAGENSVYLNIEVTSKSAVADVIAQLRTFDTITVGNLSTITETKDESGLSTVSFSVDCTYVNTVTAEEE